MSALRTGRLYPLENISGTNFCLPQGHRAVGSIISMKNSNNTIGNRTRDHPACSAVPQPIAPPRAAPHTHTHTHTHTHIYIYIVNNSLYTSISTLSFVNRLSVHSRTIISIANKELTNTFVLNVTHSMNFVKVTSNIYCSHLPVSKDLNKAYRSSL